MINCPNCGSLNSEGSMVCGNCGMNLLMNNNTNDSINNNNINNNSSEVNNSVVIETNQNINGTPAYEEIGENYTMESNAAFSNEDLLVDIFIGQNANKIKNSKFSIWAFLFGVMYVLYRKMYKLFAILFGISLITSLIFVFLKLNIFSLIVGGIISIFLGIKFNDLYLKYVSNEINKIRSSNNDDQEINNICKKKGGVSGLVALCAFVIAASSVIILLPFLTSIKTVNKKVDNARESAFINHALIAVDAVKNDILANGMEEASKVYTTSDINNLLETKLATSPYGKEYKDISIQVIKTINSSYIYKICMIDTDNNGFGYTYESEISESLVLKGNAPDVC